MINKLFVYGTLGPGRPNEHVLAKFGGRWLEGHIFGRLQQQGWGAEMGYPGIVLDANADKVQGFVFVCDTLDQHLAELDEFEGEGYQRTEVQVHLDNGDTTQAYVYALANNS